MRLKKTEKADEVACVRTVQRLRVGQVLLELFVQVFADSDVLEHPLQFGRVLEAARLLHDNNNRKSMLVTCHG